MVQAPVGIRCRECGRPVPLPTFDVRPANYAKALIAAGVIAVLGVILWLTIWFFSRVWGLPFIVTPVVTPLIVGYAAGEVISRVVNLKRSRGLMYIAGGTVIAATVIGGYLTGGVGLWGILGLIGGVFIAIARVRL